MKLILILVTLGMLAGCSHSILAKECKAVQDDSKYVCKSILPWQ
jgi:hypothetical protein